MTYVGENDYNSQTWNVSFAVSILGMETMISTIHSDCWFQIPF